MKQITATLVLILLAVPSVSLAQELRAPLQAGSSPPGVPAEVTWSASTATPERGMAARVIHLASGVLAGAWVGYMASQVAVGDWDDRAIDRASWAAGGAALGLTMGLTIPAGRAGRPAAVQAPDRQARNKMLTGIQIQEAQGGSLYDVIRSLRPQWLRTRGTGSMRETARGQASGLDEIEIDVRPGIPTIPVYLDGSRLGGTDKLRNIDPAQVGEVRFFSPAEATHRWGAGHINGAILVITAPVI